MSFMKILKKTLKILSIVIISILLFMVVTVVAAKIFEDELVSFTVDKLEEKLEAPISVKKVSVIPLFSFPRLSAEINELYVGDPRSSTNDTLLFINSLKVGMDTWDLLYGAINIDDMQISGLDFDYLVDSTGNSNIDFILDAFSSETHKETKKDTTSTPLDLSAEKFKLENIRVRYYDSESKIGTQAMIPEITLNAKTKNNIYKGKTKGSIVLSHCYFPDTKINLMNSCTIAFNLELEDVEAEIKDFSIVSEGLNLDIEGRFRYADTISANTVVSAKHLNFDILKKYIPDNYLHLVGKQKLAEMESLKLNIKADYFQEKLQIEKMALTSDGIEIGVVGDIEMGDTTIINTRIEPISINLNILKKYVLKQYLDEYGIRDFGGNLDFAATINGKIADSTLLPNVDIEANIKKLSLTTADYPQIDAINLNANITNGSNPDLSTASVKISKAEIFTPNSYLSLNGNVKGIQNSRYNLNTKMNLNLVDFADLMPDSLARNLSGKINAAFSTFGVLPNEFDDDFIDYALKRTNISLIARDVEALLFDTLYVENFGGNINYLPQDSGHMKVSIDTLSLKSDDLGIDIQNTSLLAVLSGNISDVDNMGVDLKRFHFQNGQSTIEGNALITNLSTPEFNINTNISLLLDDFTTIVPYSLVNKLTGKFSAGIQTHGKICFDSIDTQFIPILFENSSFYISTENISIEMPSTAISLEGIANEIAYKDDKLAVDNLCLQLSLKNDVLNINGFTFNFNGFDFGMDSTVVKNLYSAVLLNQPKELFVDTRINIGDIFYDDYENLVQILLNDSEPDSLTEITNEITEISEPTNWTFLIHGSASVKSVIIDSTSISGFKIHRLHVNDMSTLFKLTDSAYIIDKFKFKAFEGEMTNSFHYKIREDGYETVSTHNIINNMNVRTLLKDMDNFGMDSVIRWQNISGLLSTDLNTFIPVDKSVREDKICASGDIILEKGGVYDYDPATEISRFTGIKELDNIQFKTLHSNIFMYKNSIYIPRTEIVSNALDIAAFGEYNLNGDCEYHLEIHLGNIIFGKSDRRNKKQDESGDEIDEATLKKNSRKIRYSILDGKSKPALDSKKSREEMQVKIKTQKTMLNFIFFPKNIHYNTDLD